jgi:metallo-beta-lactamase family protein
MAVRSGRIVEGTEVVKIFSETIAVKARIATINGFSGPAGQSELVEWFDSLSGSRPRVMMTHGEDKSRQALAKIINERYHLRSVLPTAGQALELN